MFNHSDRLSTAIKISLPDEKERIIKIWKKEGKLILLPELLELLIMQQIGINNYSPEESLYPAGKEGLFSSLIKSIGEIDSITGLQTPEFMHDNAFLYELYLSCREEHQLPEIKLVKIWGDFKNLGGLQLSLHYLVKSYLSRKRAKALKDIIERKCIRGWSLEYLSRSLKIYQAYNIPVYAEKVLMNLVHIYMLKMGQTLYL